MTVYLITLVAFLAVMAGMAIGVIIAGKRIQGSCGGLSAWRDELGRPMCEACAECPEKKQDCELEEAGEVPAGEVPAGGEADGELADVARHGEGPRRETRRRRAPASAGPGERGTG